MKFFIILVIIFFFLFRLSGQILRFLGGFSGGDPREAARRNFERRQQASARNEQQRKTYAGNVNVFYENEGKEKKGAKGQKRNYDGGEYVDFEEVD